MIVKILTNKEINSDKVSLGGRALVTKRIYESFTDYKSVFINAVEFIKLNDHMNRVNYLISHGIY